jgi:hypothetical protein
LEISNTVQNQFIGIMLSGLPSEYNPMIMALGSCGAKITSESVKLKEDIRRDTQNKL